MISRRTVLGAAGAGAAFALVTDGADAAPALGTTLATGLVVPWGLAFLPDGDALVTERESGDVHRVHRGGGRTHVGTIAATHSSPDGEGGLLGVAVSPGFDTDGLVYFYVTTSTDNRVLAMHYDGGGLSDRGVVIGGIPANVNHNGGRIAFGPDRLLYVATGDARNGGLAQRRGSLAGKILRINPDGTVPRGNPWAGNPVWTRGHRNVQGLAWDANGRMFATEFGERDRDELNRIVKGHNYGWPRVEGSDGRGGFHDPFVQWAPTSTCSPSGLAVARGKAWVAALRGRCVYAVQLSGRRARRRTRYFHEELGRIRTVERAPDGSLWVTTSNRDGRGTPGAGDDKVVRIDLG